MSVGGGSPGLADVARVDVDSAAIARSERDFGNLVTGRSRGVVCPESLLQLTKIVDAARQRRERLTVRGGGMSQGGQGLPDDSFVIDMCGWRQIDAVDREGGTVTCGPGATWRNLLSETLPLGLVPKVLPLNLDLSVAGTLSAGGMGSTSHRKGFAVSHVVSAQIVLGTGELVTAGPAHRRDVFDAVFGGCGRVGIIGSVQLALEPAPQRVQTSVLRYDTAGALLADLEFLALQPWAYHVGAMCSASVLGLKKGIAGGREPLKVWSFGLELTRHCDGPTSAGDELDGLHFTQILHEEVDELTSFLARYDVRFEMMRATGAWEQAHPWFEALVPLASADAALQKVMALPAFFGDGHRIALVADTERPLALAFPGTGPAVVLAVLPPGVPPTLAPRALDAIAEMDSYILSVGGCRYVSGWLSHREGASWRQQYSRDYARLAELKGLLDPENVFRSRMLPLTQMSG